MVKLISYGCLVSAIHGLCFYEDVRTWRDCRVRCKENTKCECWSWDKQTMDCSFHYAEGWEKGGIWDLHANGKAFASCKIWEDDKMHWDETWNGNYLKGAHLDCCEDPCVEGLKQKKLDRRHLGSEWHAGPDALHRDSPHDEL